MRQIMSADMVLVLFGVVFSAALVPTALAEDALDPMTSVGGIMRDAERRALAHTDTGGGKPASAPAAVDPSLFNIRNGTVYGLNQNIDAEELVIPAGVKGVCIDGLVHGNVRRIVIPEGVVRLGRQSGGYRPGTKIEAVKLPASVRDLSPTAFDGHWSRLHSIEVAEGSPYLMKDGCLIDTRNDSLVFALPGQERIIVPPSVKTIGEYAFNSNDATEIVIPEGVLEIGRGAFYDCRSLEQISIPASLIAIKSDAFKNCGRLAKIAVAHGNQRFSARDGLLIDRESATLLRAFGPLVSVTISDDVRIIGANAFSFLKSVVSIVVPDSVRRIEDDAFSYCTNLEVLRLPEQVEFCEDHFIMGCESLRSVHIPKGLGSLSGMFSIGGCSSLREIVLPEGLRTISTGGLGAICRCDALERIVLPSSVTRIGPGGAFRENKNLKMFEVHPDNLAFRAEDGVLFSKDMTRLVRCPEAKMGVYKIPDTVQKIDACAFAQCRNLSEIYIPTSVTDIGYGAFKDCPAKTNRVTTLNGEASQSAATKDLPEFVRIPAGVNAGAAPYADLGHREYENKMSHDMYMDATEVTFLKWRTVKEWAKTNGYEFINGDKAPDFIGGGDSDKLFEIEERDVEKDKYPVTGMTWYDCLKWCNARSEMDGLEPVYYVDGKPYKKGVHEPAADVSKSGWRLPTEDEWQYAARGGKLGLRFPWGNTISHKNASYNGMKNDRSYPYDQSDGEHPIYDGPGEAPVASFDPNGYGLYDIVGNAQEFTQDSDDEWVTVCGGRIGQLAHFLQIQHHDGTKKTARGSGFRAMRLAADKKAKSETTIVVDQEIVGKMVAAIKDAVLQPRSKMAHFARNMATFPSWNKSLKGTAYSVGDYVCVLQKSPPLDIDADSYRWRAGLGDEKYRARIKELRTSNLSYLHSLAIYNSTWRDGAVPIPCIVLTVELSRSTEVPYVCAFTPDGHKNFGKTEALSSDDGMLLNSLAAVSLAFDKTPDKVGDAEEGFSLLKRMKDKPKGNKTTCTNCKGSGLVNGSICLECKGWGKMSDDKRQR